MEASFKAFLERPENRPLVEDYQRREARKALLQTQRQQALRFRQKVLDSERCAQESIAPFLENRLLRRVIQTFTNDPNGNFAVWANNPEVLRMLTTAKQMMDDGLVCEEDMERCLLAQLQDPDAAQAEPAKGLRPAVHLATDQLVSALNEHLAERRQGNNHYLAGRFEEALVSYGRARAIVELVKGTSTNDQQELDSNKVAVYLNIAAVHLAMEHHAAAADMCSKALELQPANIKALLRRSKAFIRRHELQAARKDLIKAAELQPDHPDLRQLQFLLQKKLAAAGASSQ